MLLKMKPNSLGLQQQTLLGADSNDSYVSVLPQPGQGNLSSRGQVGSASGSGGSQRPLQSDAGFAKLSVGT